MRGRTALLVAAAFLVASPHPLRAQQAQHYTPRNGVLNWKALVFGGAFRVTTAIPLHGDFSRFDRVEVVRAKSLIGRSASPAFLRRLTDQLTAEFRKGGRFTAVSVVPAYERAKASTPDEGAAAGEFRTADSLVAPMRPAADLARMDRERAAVARADEGDTLVVTDEVIDYSKGNKFLQLLFLNLGNGLVTLRLSYYDKATGEELGRSIVSSDNSSKVVPSLLSTRTPLTGVAEGLVDQVTRRKVAAER